MGTISKILFIASMVATPFAIGCGADAASSDTVDGGATVDAASPPDASLDAKVPTDVNAPPPPEDASSDAFEEPVDAAPPYDRDAVKALLSKVATFQLGRADVTNNDWIEAVFYAGLVEAYAATNDPALLAGAKKWSTDHKWDLHTSGSGPRFADNQACTQAYLDVYSLEPTTSNAFMFAKAQAAFDQMVAAPKQGRVEWWWCDALFMAPPTMTRLAVWMNQPKYVDLMDTMYWDTKDFLYDPAHKLVWRDKNWITTDTFWARGNGWVIAGLARILEVLPSNSPRHADYVSLFKSLAETLRPLQGDDGMWRSDLLHPDKFPNPETSGTGLFTYAMAWGIANGYLDRTTFGPIVKKAWNGLVSVVDAQGQVGFIQTVGDRPAAAVAGETHPYGVGAFLLAGSWIMKL